MSPNVLTPPSSSLVGSSMNTTNSPDTPSKRGFFKKILRRSNLKSSRHKNSDTPDSVNNSVISNTSSPRIKSRNGRDGSVVSGKNNSKRHSFTGFIDDDNTILFDDESEEKFSLSSGSIESGINEGHDLFDGYDFNNFNEKIRFPTLNETNNGDGPDIDIPIVATSRDSPWVGLNPEALHFPKYIKTTRKNKHSPKVINNLFLAQELNNGDDGTNDQDRTINQLHSSESSEEENNDDNYENDITLSDAEIEDSSRDNLAEVFVLEFSRDGKYLATAGRNSVIKIWKVISSPLGRLESKNESTVASRLGSRLKRRNRKKEKVFDAAPIFHEKPYRVLKGHSQSVLSLDWSKNNFLISGSMDRTVKLWHVDRDDCLQTFDHEDFVTSIKFHPNDDRFFLSGSLDNQVRLWSILENTISFSNNLGDNLLITALSITPDGEFCIVGGFYGTVIVMEVNGLHIKSKIDIKDRSLAHPFSQKNGNKITGIQIYETLQYNEKEAKDPLSKWAYLLTTNDSKLRLVNLTQKKLVTRFKGLTNNSSSIQASLTDDHNYIISGSEDHWCYIWENNNSIINNKLRLHLQELMIESKHHLNDLHFKHKKYAKVIQDNKLLKKLLDSDLHLEYVANENNSYTSFHAHNSKVNAAVFAPESTKKLLELSDDVVYDLVKRFREFKFEVAKGDSKCDVKSECKGSDLNPNEVSNGHIIVTTDRFGCIRVFRQDSAYRIRKRLIEMHKNKTTSECKIPTVAEAKKLPNMAARRLSRNSKSPSLGSDSYFNFKGKDKPKNQIQSIESAKFSGSGRNTPNSIGHSTKHDGTSSPIRSVIYNLHFNVSRDSLTSQ